MHFKSLLILSCSLATFASAIAINNVNDVVDDTAIDTADGDSADKPVSSITPTSADFEPTEQPVEDPVRPCTKAEIK
ncbi:hypothetical protein C0992_007994, partial [Termitomyces sp. T32_za158]